MKSVMSHDFSRIPKTDIQVSKFDRSHGVKTAFDSGYLVPIFLDEVLPGDTYEIKASMLAKMLSPMVSAPMDNIFLETQWFYCPSRLLYNNFTRLMGERKNPKDSIDFIIPTLNSGENGLPLAVSLIISVFLLMCRIWKFLRFLSACMQKFGTNGIALNRFKIVLSTSLKTSVMATRIILTGIVFLDAVKGTTISLHRFPLRS
jgi:hypothetical protein